MIVEHEEGGYSKAALARRYGISRKTLGKWISRYELESIAGLVDRSRAPHHQAFAVSEEVEQEVLRLKQQWPLWGAPKLHFKLCEQLSEERCPSESTVSNILKRHGLTKPKKRRLVIGAGAPQAYGQAPNDVWCTDFKGWFHLGNTQRCDPLTITDASSRYLIRCQGLVGSTSYEVVEPHFIAAFREYGLPTAIRSDNGPPFASQGLGGLSKLSVWWLKLGIRLERIEPGHPEQNGRHERMHRTLKENIGEPAQTLRAQQKVFGQFQRHYNEERPHEGIGMAVPATKYEPSTRSWSERRVQCYEYSDEWETRSVRGAGQMKWGGKDIRITSALSGERIGLKPVGDGRWEIYFCNHLLGYFDERKARVIPIRSSV
jgi:transposase InsO family protein